jgi:two-component system chemotaxis response regulator CheY
MSKTILIVDDSATMRQMISFTLGQAGFNLAESVDGLEALAWARANPADLVVTDVNMPNMDGITLVGELRKLPAYKFTPILVVTTESGPDMKQKGRAAGATGWIVKPFSPEKLVETVQKVI